MLDRWAAVSSIFWQEAPPAGDEGEKKQYAHVDVRRTLVRDLDMPDGETGLTRWAMSILLHNPMHTGWPLRKTAEIRMERSMEHGSIHYYGTNYRWLLIAVPYRSVLSKHQNTTARALITGVRLAALPELN